MPTVLRAKCLVVGDSAVGKSAVTQVFHSDGSHFPKNYSMTVGVELCTKTVMVPEKHDSVELFIYDCAGKEIFSETIQKHWDHPSLMIVVYDITSETSFHSCAKWIQRVRSLKPEMHIPGILVANKSDLEERRLVSPKEGRQLAESFGLEYFECSAKEMHNVDPPFIKAAQMFYELYHDKLDMFKSVA